MNFDWRTLLTELNQLILTEELHPASEKILSKVEDSGWLGYQDASQQQIAEAETRLGRKRIW